MSFRHLTARGRRWTIEVDSNVNGLLPAPAYIRATQMGDLLATTWPADFGLVVTPPSIKWNRPGVHRIAD